LKSGEPLVVRGIGRKRMLEPEGFASLSRIDAFLASAVPGAYTASYASVGFNGFAPIRTWCV
jgi:hypothetical protein